jgi:hypothetical protein
MAAYERLEGVFADAAAVRTHALSSAWEDALAHDGQVYKRVAPVPSWAGRELTQRLAEHLGRPPHIVAAAFRLNHSGELPNALIHSDGDGWGRYALVVGLQPSPPAESGTAFWRHRASGRTHLASADYEGILQVVPDWDRPEAFEQVDLAPLTYNVGTIYESSILHSRWPFEAYGTNNVDGRLTLVAFFT